MMLIIMLIVSFTFAVLHAWYDATEIKLGNSIEYLPRIIVRVVVFLMLSVLALPYDILEYGILVFMNMSLFWLVFDMSINYFLGRHLWSIGSTSTINKFTKKYFGEYYTVGIKLILFGIGFISYLLYYDYTLNVHLYD